MNFNTDTIVALSTPPGEGGLGVIRLSGKDAIRVADQIFKSKSGVKIREQKSFTASLGHVVSKKGKEEKILDEAILLLMRSPKSYTREDVVEISTHGSVAVLNAVVRSALEAGARSAEPGEFTKRAFLNGRIDLLKAEAVLDLIRAKTDRAREWASSRLEGRLSDKMRWAKDKLVEILSHLEAAIDFPEEELGAQTLPGLSSKLSSVASDLKELLSAAELGLIAGGGITVVIAGRPNAGKSSLMNRLCGKTRMIVTPFPGTTRDVVEEQVQIGGFPVRFLDTAGIRQTDHPIEKEGIRLSQQTFLSADLLLCVFDGSVSPLEESDLKFILELPDKKKIIVINKTDLPQQLNASHLKNLVKDAVVVETSCTLETGVQALENEILRFITKGSVEIPEDSVIGSARQKHLLEKTCKSVEDAARACREGLSPEFIAVDVRLALGALGEMVGDVVTDDVLDALFGQFCIGK